MERKFALVVFDIENKITDRFNLSLASEPEGLGFRLKLSTIETDIESIITKVVEEKKTVKLRINNIAGYTAGNILSNWIQKYTRTDSKMGLEYNDTKRTRYCEGKVTELTKTEIDNYGTLRQDLVFRPITPFFSNIENLIKIQVSSTGKTYPYRYPYAYGKNVVENNIIENPYIQDVPLTVKINGSIESPFIQLLDENGDWYNRILFDGLTLTASQHIIINSSDRKIWYYNGNKYQDYTYEVSPLHDTYLRAKSGISTLSINLEVSDTGSVVGSWRQYGL